MSHEVQPPLDRLADVYVCFRDGSLDEWNQRLVEVTGYSPTELRGMRPAGLFGEAEGQRVATALARATETGSQRVTATLQTATEGGVAHEFALSGTGEAGDGVVGIGREVTEQSAAPGRERRAVRRMTDAVTTVDAGWRFTFVDHRATELLGLDEQDLVGERLWDVFDGDLGDSFEGVFREVMRSRQASSLEEYHEGLDAWVRANVYPNDDGGLSVYFRDVSERHRRQRILEERERVLREMYEITADGDRSFVERVEGLLDIGRSVLDTRYGTLSRIEGEDYHFEVVSAADEAIEAGDVTDLSATNCERTAATQGTLVLANVARDAPDLTDRAGFTDWGIACYLGAPVVVDGEVSGTFCFYDVEPREGEFSEWEVTLVDLMAQWVSYERTRQRTHERLESRNERLDEFASIVSHDLRNPLSIAQGRLDMAREECDSTHLSDVQGALDRMTALIDDLLELARDGRTATDLVAVDLEDVATDCWGALPEQPGTLAVETDRRVRADESQLRQLLANLLRNAVEHAGEDATVTVGSLPEGFYVADDGAGVPAADRDRVFDAGYTTDSGGTGLGLALVSRIADAHGWEVALTESERGGARFEVTRVAVVEE